MSAAKSLSQIGTRISGAECATHTWTARRQARKRGLVILGTRKIWDSSLAAIGMLWAKRQGKRQFRAYHDRVFERFLVTRA